MFCSLPSSACVGSPLLLLAGQLNETYKIDFTSLKQIRRDDADRWRFIKRGGSATDGPPGANGFVADDDAEADEVKDADAADEDEDAPVPKKKGAKAAAAKPAAKGKAAAAKKDEPAPPPAAAWSVPPTDSPFKKGAAGVAPTPRDPVKRDEDAAAPMSDDEESVPNGKARSGGTAHAAAAAASSKPAAAAAASSSSGAEEKKLRAELDSIRKQMADLEAELETSQSAAEAAQKKLAAEVARLTSAASASKAAAEESKKLSEEVESLRAKNAAATKSLAQSDARAAKAERELTSAQEAAHKAQAAADEVSKKLAAANKAQQAAEARATKAEAASAANASAVADLAALRTKYASVLTAIKPVAATFGMAPTTVIGAAIIEFDKNGGAFKAGAASAAPAAAATAAAAAATPAKKRGRDDEMQDDDDENAATQELVSTAKKARPTPAAPTSAASAASPRRDDDERHSDAPSDDEGGAASPRAAAASRNIDDDATQPMVAPNSDDEGMADAKPAAASKFLHNPNALDSALISKVGDKTVPLCIAAVPASSASGPHLVVVGGRNGSLQLFEMAPSVPARLLPLTMAHRPPHKIAPRESPKAGEDGEQYALTSHVLAMVVVPLKAPGSYLLFAGEGRLLRVYTLTIASAAGKLSLLTEFEMGKNSWVTCLTRLYAPASVRQANQEHVGVGVSGEGHLVQIYSIATGGAAAVVKLERSMSTRSDEVRALAQLRRDGRLVIAGCSALLDGSMNEGGSIELHAWDGAAKSRQSGTHLHCALRACCCVPAPCVLLLILLSLCSVCVAQVFVSRSASASDDRPAVQFDRGAQRHGTRRRGSNGGRIRVLQQRRETAGAVHVRHSGARPGRVGSQRRSQEQSLARREHIHVSGGQPEPTEQMRGYDVRRLDRRDKHSNRLQSKLMQPKACDAQLGCLPCVCVLFPLCRQDDCVRVERR